MGLQGDEALRRNSIFAWIAAGTGAVLLVPWIAMRLGTGVDWGPEDFITAGLLVFGTGSLYVIVARRMPRRRRIVIGLACGAAMLYAWAELAVGVFTNLGS